MNSPTSSIFSGLESIVKLDYDHLQSIHDADDDGEVESPAVVTGLVNAATGEIQPTLTIMVEGHQPSEVSTYPELQNMDKGLEDTSPGEDLQLSKVAEVLTEMIKKSASSLRRDCPCDVLSPTPLSFRVYDEDGNIVQNQEEAQRRLLLASSENNTKVQSDLMGKTDVSFELPNDYDRSSTYLNKLKVPVAEVGLNQSNEKMRQFSFNERLQGWKIECKSRPNGRFDKYYYHKKAKKTFRSTKEVVNFMMYEAYPKPQRMGNGNSKDQEHSTPLAKPSSSKSNKKFKSGSAMLSRKEELIDQVESAIFFEEAYNTLLNYEA